MVSPGGWEGALLLVMLAAAATLVVALLLLNWVHRRRDDREQTLDARLEGLWAEWLARRPSPAEMAWLAGLSGAERRVLFRRCLRTFPGLDADSRARLRRVLERSGLLEREVAALRASSWDQRAEACRILGGLGHAAAAPALVERLKDSDATVRQQAIVALGDLGAVEGMGPIVEALDASAGWANLIALMALSRMGRESAPVIGSLLAASDSPSRTKGLLQVTTQLGAAADLEQVLALAGHPDPEIRVEAVRTLGSLPPSPASVDVCLAAMDDQAWPTRALAARSLGSLGDTRAVPRLAQAMGDPAYWVRHRAGEALSRLSEAGRDALERALDDANPFVRDMARQALVMRARESEVSA